MTIMKIIDGLYFTIGMILFNPLTGESKTPDQLNEDDRATYDACMGAIALLKAREPRVMTIQEAKSASGYVIVQSRSCNILELQLIKNGLVYDSFTVPIAVDDLWWEGYNKHWRLWTFVPTDEQMEKVKWDE